MFLTQVVSTMTQFVQIQTTTGDPAVAERIATELVDQRLVACVQVAGNLRSTYRWQGAVEHTEELLVTMKTTQECVEDVKATILRLHPYDVPELIVVPIIDGSQEYLAWVEEQVR